MRTALDAAEPTFSVLYIHGPGGIGKTRLLYRFAQLAEDADATVVRLDGRTLEPTPPAVLEVLRASLDVPDGDATITCDHGRVVLLFDTYERVAQLDDWVRMRLIPRLPASAVTVLAGRAPPDPAWRTDSGWGDLLRIVSVRNLTLAETREYLVAAGVDESLHERIVAASHGHPLGLSLLTDLVSRGDDVDVDPLPAAQAASGVVVLSASRPCLEAYVRERVRSLPGVTFAAGRDILGLVTTPDGGRVIGARLIPRADGGTEETMQADLVVDASGRGSRLPLWLEALGYGRPDEEKVSAGVAYATGIFRLRPGALGHDRAIIAAPTPAHVRGAGLAEIEGQRHIVTLMGMLGDRPPTDIAGFLDFARSLPIPDVYDAIVGAEPLEELVGFGFPASVRRRYERMRRFPDGQLVMGDGICSLNPIYGQGMSVAAIEALTLREHLKRGHHPRPRRVLRDFAKAIDAPWEMAAGADLAFPGVDGRRNGKARMANSYIPRLHAAAAHDAALAIEFLRVAGLVEHPAALFRPSVVMRVIKHSLRPNRHAAEGYSAAAGHLP
jgi:hypothetical protein